MLAFDRCVPLSEVVGVQYLGGMYCSQDWNTVVCLVLRVVSRDVFVWVCVRQSLEDFFFLPFFFWRRSLTGCVGIQYM